MRTLKIDLDADKRVMNWRTSGVAPFDVESMRGTATESPFAELARWFSEARITNKIDRSAFIRAEVEAMDWPQVFEDATLQKVIDE